MKKLINAIKNYIKDYEKMQVEWISKPGYYHYMAQMNATINGYCFY